MQVTRSCILRSARARTERRLPVTDHENRKEPGNPGREIQELPMEIVSAYPYTSPDERGKGDRVRRDPKQPAQPPPIPGPKYHIFTRAGRSPGNLHTGNLYSPAATSTPLIWKTAI